MNLLDLIVEYLQINGPSTSDQVASIINPAPIIGGLGEVVADYGDRWTEDHTTRLRMTAAIDVKRRAQAKRANLGGSAHLAVAVEIRRTAGLRGRPRKGTFLEAVA